MTAAMLALTVWSGLGMQPAAAGPFEALKYFEGRWSGTGTGEPGCATVEREYQFVLQGKFLQVKNVSRWGARPGNPSGETHEDLGFMSHDRSRKAIVYRQFHVEGFVNQYVLQPVGDPKVLVFESEAIENIAAGWRARETCNILGDDEFEEVFELAAPGRRFEVYSRTRLRRWR